MESRSQAGSLSRLVLFLLCLFIYNFAPVFSVSTYTSLEDYLVDHWDTARGLPSNVIHSIAQTPDGYLWVATHNGLVRFDGITFTPLRFASEEEKRSGKTALAQSLFLDKDNILWIGSSIGLTSYEYKNRQFKTYTPSRHPGLPSGNIRRIYQDKEGNLWLGFISGSLCRFSRAGNTFSPYVVKEGSIDNTINAILEDSDGKLLVGTRKEGVFKINNSGFVKESFPSPAKAGYLISMFRDSENSLWYCKSQGLFRKKETKVEKYIDTHGLSASLTTVVLEGDKKQYWIGTEKGLDLFDDDTGGSPQIRRVFTSSAIVCLFKDREGSVWAGTYADGLKRIKPTRIKSFNPLGKNSPEVLIAMFRESNGSILLSTASGNLYRMDKERKVQPINSPPLAGTGIYGIYRDKQNTLWLASNGEGVFRSQEDGFLQYRKKDGLSHDFVTSIMEDVKGNVWFATHGGVCVWNRAGERFRVLDSKHGLPFETVHHIHQDHAMNIWIAGDDGLVLLPAGIIPSDGSNPDLETPVMDKTITWIYEDASSPSEQGTVFWMGTNGEGLIRFNLKDQHPIFYTLEHGLSCSSVYKFFEDSQGYFWCQSTKGILRIAKSTLNSLAADETNRIHCVLFDRNDGIRYPEFKNPFPRHTAFQKGKSEFWFLTGKEISVITPSTISLNLQEPPVVIQMIYVDGKPVTPHQEAKLHIFQELDNIQFSFTAPSLLSSEKIVFRYRLKGREEQWHYLSPGKERNIRYSDLKKGDYTFEVSARNADGVWNSGSETYAFIITPSSYKFPYLEILLFAGLLVIVGFLLYRRLKTRTPIDQKGDEEPREKKVTSKSTLQPDFVLQMEKKILHLMEVEKVYRDEKLTLPMLAEKLKIPRYQLSQILNDHFNRHFNDFVNYYRIEEAKAIMAGPGESGKSNRQIAVEIGFNTETAFYNAFKKFTGNTPGQYRKDALKKE